VNRLFVISFGLAIFVFAVLIVYIAISWQNELAINTSSNLKGYSLKIQDSNGSIKKYILNLSNQKFERINIILDNKEREKYPIYENNDPERKILAGYDFDINNNKINIYLYFESEYLDVLKKMGRLSEFNQPTFYTLLALEQADADAKGVPIQIDLVVKRINETIKSMTDYPVVIE